MLDVNAQDIQGTPKGSSHAAEEARTVLLAHRSPRSAVKLLVQDSELYAESRDVSPRNARCAVGN